MNNLKSADHQSDEIERSATLELRKHVCKILRPLSVSKAKRRRMRDELYAHLHAIYLQEIRLGKDPQRALKASYDRLGDISDLQSDLQTTAGTRERWQARCDAWFSRRPAESAWQFAIHGAVQLLLMQLVLNVIAFTGGMLVTGETNVSAIVPFVTLMTLLLSFNGGLAMFLTQRLSVGIRPLASPVKILAAAAFGMSALVSEVLLYSMGRQNLMQLITQDASSLQILSLIAFFAGAGMFFVVTTLLQLEERQDAPWRDFEAEEC